MKKILVIFFILIGTYWIITNWIHFDWLPFGRNEDHVSVTDKVEWISIDVSNLSTSIIPENRKDMKAEVTGNGIVHVDRNGDKITVSAKRKWFNFFSFGREKLKIYLPEDYQKSLEINLSSGNLHFAGKSKNNPVKLENLSVDIGSGNLELVNLNVKHLEHDGSSGNVNISSLTTKTGVFEVSSGSLNLKNYSGKLDAELSSGKLSVEMDQLVDDIHIEVSSGTVNLNLPQNASFTLNGKSNSGSITCDFPLTSHRSNNRTISGTHGSGKHDINLNVSSGNIHIY